MNSEKVKEIKYYLEQSACMYGNMQKQALTLINELESENERLKNDNELLRKAKVVYENVDYCYEDLKKAQDRIAELENIGLNEEITVGEYLREMQRLKDRIAELEKVYDRQVRIINDLNIEVVKEQEKLPKFVEMLKEKLKEKVNADNVDVFVECAKLSAETLKEFIK